MPTPATRWSSGTPTPSGEDPDLIPLVSAHGAGLGLDPDAEPLAALERAARLGADFVELDVRRCRDGVLVLAHDRDLAVGGGRRRIAELTAAEIEAAGHTLVRYDTALACLAGRARAHLDLKFRSTGSAHELAAVEQAVDVLGAGSVLVTTGNVRAIRAVREWARERHPGLHVALSVGGSVAGRSPAAQLRGRRDQLFPGRRLDEADANAVAANHWLALLTVGRLARRRGLPLAVWTVDDRRLLRHWLRPGRAWLVVTNRPDLAMVLRAGPLADDARR